jgi:hypothetical protein
MATEEYLVDPVSVGFDLALNFFRKGTFPESFLVPEKCLELCGRRPARIIEKLETRDAAVAVEDDELGFVGGDERILVDTALLHDVLRQIPHVRFALVEKPRNCGRLVFEFPMTVVCAVYDQRAQSKFSYSHDAPLVADY